MSDARPAVRDSSSLGVWKESISSDSEFRVLVFAPTASDARITQDFLSEAGIRSETTASCRDLCLRMVEGCGALLIAEEVLNHETSATLFGLLAEQPAWSDLPLILITTPGARGVNRVQQLRERGFEVTATILERPFQPWTLTSTLAVALRSRRRQYQVQRLLADVSSARDSAEKANRAKDDFLAALSHELRTPLNPVLLVASEGAANTHLPESVRNDFQMIARNIELEARLIDDLLDVTRVIRGKLPLQVRSLDAHHVIRETLRIVAGDFSAKRLEVSLDLGASQAIISADPVRIQQVFWNIMKNAAKFTPEGGQVRVVTRNESGMLCIEFSDTGVGLLPHEIDHIFEAFAQGDHARGEGQLRFEGLGLGLAISRQIIQLHGGRIYATSAGRNAGCTFTLVIPLDANPALGMVIPFEHAPDAPPKATPSSRRILLVEDHGATRASLARILQRRGFSVEVAESVAEARAVLRSKPIDLLISDIGLPDGTGHQLMEEFRDTPNLRGIAMSGFGTDIDIAESRRLGFVAHLTKPVSIRDLDATLAGLV